MAEQNERLASFLWILAAAISLLPCWVQLGVMVSLLAGRTFFPLVFPAAVLASLLASYGLLLRSGFTRAEQWQAAGILLLLLGVSLALSAFFFDFSWDGEWYHQAAIIHIARDWNPLTDPMRIFVEHILLSLRHYAKGPWYFAAAVWAATGHFEWGKAINWLALAASFLALLAACLNGGLRRREALGIAAVAAINPVVMSELTTYMVDAVMVAFLVVAAAALFTCLHRPSTPALIAGVAGAIVSINAKFTGLVYLCFVLAAGALWCLLKRRAWFPKFLAATAVALVLGVCVWGYNPYLTNTYYRHQPFYPMLGSAQYPSVDQSNHDGNEMYETPKNMVGRSLPYRFFYAVFGRPGNQPYTKGRNASLMLPFTAVPADLYAYKYHETRVAGFGPFFSGCLVLSFLLGVWILVGKEPLRWLLVLMVLTVLASLSLSRHLWWPRYGPQFWLVAILPLAFTLRHAASGHRRPMTRMVLCLLLVNAVIVSFVRLRWETKASITLRQQLRQMRDSGQEYEVQTMYFDDSMNVRLHAAGVKFSDVGMKALPNSLELMSVVEEYPAPVRYRVAAHAPFPLTNYDKTE